MKIGLSADHRGYKLKEILKVYLQEKGYEIEDFGTSDFERIDFPEFAFSLCEKVISQDVDFGIAICGTGIGMSIACNKVKGIYCAKVSTIKEAKYARAHNDANVLAISGKMNHIKAKMIVKKFIKTELDSEETYKNRIMQIKKYEGKK